MSYVIPRVVVITVKGLIVSWPAAVCATALFIYLSTARVMLLRTEPPPEFCESGPDWSPERREAEQRLASAYWESARDSVQWRYRFGEALPSNPPPEFALDPETARDMNLHDTPANRLRYWRRFTEIWRTPNAWRQSHKWDTSWLRRALVWMRDETGAFVAHLFGFDSQ